MLLVNVFDEAFYDVIDIDQDLEVMSEGFEFIEGPIWDSKEQHITFSDIPACKIYRFSEKTGVTLIRDNTNKANGLSYDKQGNIICCEHAKSRISRFKSDGSGYEVLASHYYGKELNSPNDVIVKSDGNIYFSDPFFGRNPSRVGVPREQELDFQGVYMINPKTKELTLLSDIFANPNGLCFSLDEKHLYVADTPNNAIMISDVKEDGMLDNPRLFAKTIGEGVGPDGLKVDSLGNIYCAAHGGLQIFDKTAKLLGILKMPKQTANLCFGGKGLKSIYMTCVDTLYRIRCKVSGAHSI